jgi:outer membrane protein
MKKCFLIAAALILSSPLMAETLFGKVDMQKVLITIKQGSVLQGELQKAASEKESDLKKEEEKIKKMQEEFEKKSVVLKDEAKAEQERNIQKAMMSAQQKYMQYQKELQELQDKKKRPILEKVKGIVEEVSKKSGLEIVFEAGTAPIVYAKDIKDLTDDIIKAYDAKYPK